MNTKEILINEVDIYIKNFAKVFFKPQFAHFEQIIEGALFGNLKSINSYSKSYSKKQSSLNRFMNSKAIDNSQINQSMIQQVESLLDSNKEKDFIFDDTIKHHKYGKHIFGIGRHHNHLEGGFSTGHSLVAAGIK